MLAELTERARAGEWVVDLRERRAFAARHLVGTLAFELSDPLTTYLGWLLPWGSPLSLVGRSIDDLAAARRRWCASASRRSWRAGSSTVTAGEDPWTGVATGSYPVVGFSGLKPYDGAPGEIVVDVRLSASGARGISRHAMHIPLHELPDRIDEIPAGRVWAHCAAGYRASAAGSLLARAGRDVMVVSDEFSGAVAAGLDIVSECD